MKISFENIFKVFLFKNYHTNIFYMILIFNAKFKKKYLENINLNFFR